MPRSAGRVLAALRNINASLPWGRRILFGPDIAKRLATKDIPEDEVHVHFTDGKALRPTDEEGDAYGPNILGLGGSNFYRDRSRILGGHACFDREATGRGNARIEFVVTHEIMHAWGMCAHVDPHEYPNAVLVPFVPRNLYKVPRLWLTVEGEALLAETILVPGTRVSDLTVADLGPWDDEGFHLVGQAGLGEID
ncbi:MAG: hypothetical protein OXI66_03625 [Boseongicola sp.]|nr:hypothetical protein [Boseongicola sp.]